MTAEERLSPATDPEEQSSRVPKWLVVLAALVLAGVAVGVIVYGYLARPGWVGASGKKFWDYLELLIVPAALAIGVYLLNRAQERERQAQEAHREREREAEVEQREREREAAEVARRERELALQNQRAQDDALQAYLDHMSQLLADKERPLSSAQLGDNLSTMARARTLTALTRLDGERKRSVLQFLFESGLIYKEHSRLSDSGLIVRHPPVVSLEQADLSEAKLSGANLIGAYLGSANLSGADLSWASLFKAVLGGANLSKANLSMAWLAEAVLPGADLSGANLSGVGLAEASLGRANLSKANLSEANLTYANLSGVSPFEDLGLGADLSGANVSRADLSGAILTGVNFSDANLSEAQVTEEQLEQASSLAGATMPNGQKYEEWLKSKSGGEDGENNGGPS